MQEELLKTLKEIIPALVQLEMKRTAPMPSTQPPGWLPMPMPPTMLPQADHSQPDWVTPTLMPASRMPAMPVMPPCRASNQSQTAPPQRDWPVLA